MEAAEDVGAVLVPSRSKAGAYYEVAIGLDGVLICNCPASFNYLECWHVKQVREDLMTNQTTALVPVKVAPSTSLLPTQHDLDIVQQAAAMAYAGAVSLPAELNTKEKVAAVMLYGLEIGLRPMTAIQHLYIVKGKVSASAQAMAGLCMNKEPDIEFHVDPRSDHMSCTVRMLRPSRHVDASLTVTWAQIQRANLAGGTNALYPEDRLRYHCIKRLCRLYAPDLINGLDEGVAVAGVTEAPHEPWPEDGGLYNEGDAPANVDRETGEIIEHEAAATEGARGFDRAAPPSSVDDAKPAQQELSALIKGLQGAWSVEEVKALGVELQKLLPDPTAKFVISKLDAATAAAAVSTVRDAIADKGRDDVRGDPFDQDDVPDAPPEHEVVLAATAGGAWYCEVCGEPATEDGEHAAAQEAHI
jgi:hypothetical protein